MKITIITMSMMQKMQGKYYNAQDIGLGKSLVAMGNEVEVINFVSRVSLEQECRSELAPGLVLRQLPSKSVGVHSVYRKDFIAEGTQMVICFSDNQINFKFIYRLCRKHKIRCIPYVGVLGSNNASRVKGALMNVLSDNVGLYKKLHTLAKTPEVEMELKRQGVGDVTLAPVCLDAYLLKEDYAAADIDALKEELGAEYGRDFRHRMLLFVGRLQQEKQPLEMLDIFAIIHKNNPDYRLIMIGTGPLENEVLKRLELLDLYECVTLVHRVENSEMWKYLRISEALVNLNWHEIFGMSVLEAMYYETRVVAVTAPGPAYIMDNNPKLGTLCWSYDEVIESILTDDREYSGRLAHKRVQENFLWHCTAKIIMEEL